MIKFVKNFIKDENGLTTLEYIALAFGILLVVIGTVRLVGGTTRSRFNRINNEMSQNN